MVLHNIIEKHFVRILLLDTNFNMVYNRMIDENIQGGCMEDRKDVIVEKLEQLETEFAELHKMLEKKTQESSEIRTRMVQIQGAVKELNDIVPKKNAKGASKDE